MLIEGSGSAEASKPEARRKPAPGTTRLQQYVAPPAPAEDRPEPASALLEFAGQTYGPRTVDTPAAPMQAVEFAGQTYAVPDRTAVATEPAQSEAITTEKAEEEAKTYRARKAQEMSWDDYLELNNRERAAVDFNTMLIQARQKDLRSDYEPNDAQREVYDRTVERLFGDEGTSQTFAPETVALLNDLDFEQTDAKRFDDLDDFLGLASAITAKDLDKLGKLNVSPVLGEGSKQMDQSLGGLVAPEQPHETAQDVTTLLAAGTQDLQRALTRGNQVLENWKQVTAGTRNESVSYYGGTPNRLASPDIRLNQADDSYFQMAFDTLADASNGPEVMGLIQQDLGDKDFQRFLAYADTKSKYSLDQGVGLGGDPAVQYRSPDEFRQILGLSGGGETDGSR